MTKDIRARLGLRPVINVSGTMTSLGASIVVPEAVEASLQLGVLVLDALGTGAEAAARVVHELRQEDYAALREITGVQERGAQSALRVPR